MIKCSFLGVFKGSCVSIMPWQLNEGHFYCNFSKSPSGKRREIFRFFNDLELYASKVGTTSFSHPLCISRNHFSSGLTHAHVISSVYLGPEPCLLHFY